VHDHRIKARAGRAAGSAFPLPPLSCFLPSRPTRHSAEEEGGKSGKTSLLEIALSITNVGRPACWELPSALRELCSLLRIALKPDTQILFTRPWVPFTSTHCPENSSCRLPSSCTHSPLYWSLYTFVTFAFTHSFFYWSMWLA